MIKEKNWVETTSLIDVNEKPMQSQMTFHVQLKITSTNGKALWAGHHLSKGGGGWVSRDFGGSHSFQGVTEGRSIVSNRV